MIFGPSELDMLKKRVSRLDKLMKYFELDEKTLQEKLLKQLGPGWRIYKHRTRRFRTLYQLVKPDKYNFSTGSDPIDLLIDALEQKDKFTSASKIFGQTKSKKKK